MPVDAPARPGTEPRDDSQMRLRPMELARKFGTDPLNMYGAAYGSGRNVSQF
jgi:hypothetical protein